MKYLGYLCLILGVFLSGIYPTYYWFVHDSLTSMQLFKTLPWQIGGGSVLYLVGYGILTVTPLMEFLR